MNAVQVEVGCMETIPFRRLVNALTKNKKAIPAPIEAAAAAAYLRLTCDLAFDANITNRPGFLRECSLALHFDALKRLGLILEGFGEKNWKQVYLDSEFLISADNEFYNAPWFTAAGINKQTGGKHQAPSKLGGFISGFKKKVAAIEKTAQSISIKLAPEGFYSDTKGNALSSDQVKDAIALIQQIDTILRRDARLPDVSNFPAGLVLRAFEERSRWQHKLINHRGAPTSALELTCRYLLEIRDEYDFPKTTEHVLPKFSEYANQMLERYSDRLVSRGRSGQVFMDV